MKRDQELGSIAPGKLADVILVEGDPSTHISDIRRVTTTVKDGVVYQFVFRRALAQQSDCKSTHKYSDDQRPRHNDAG
jgi:Amidohydrolase family